MYKLWRGLIVFVAVLICLKFVATPVYASPNECSRIISLAPSLTEIIYELKLEDSLLANTRYCTYPAAAKDKIHVGDLYQLNLEKILELKPSVIFLLNEQQDLANKLRLAKQHVMLFEHRTVAGILDSIQTIGKLCDKQELAKKFVEDAKAKIKQFSTLRNDNSTSETLKVANSPKTLVLVLGRSSESSLTSNFYLSGSDGYFNELITLVGGENLIKTKTVSISTVNPENLLSLNPQIILEIIEPKELPQSSSKISDDGCQKERISSLYSYWEEFKKRYPILKNTKVKVLCGSYFHIPGPRFIKTLDSFYESINN